MADLTGKTIANRYRVNSLIGHGGMGDVYKVWDRQRAAFLAMKALHADMAEDQVFLRRFAREAETLSTLQHPQIVRFYGLEQDGRTTFMLMDYVEGTTLRGQIFDLHKPFTAEQVLQIMRPVCSALYYAHQMGRVHCDVKPANIMLKSNGEVLVADFGIARLMESSTTMTLVGAGTPAYMAPEQALGKKPSPQTDIYSLGIVLYEMLTGGERPFTGERANIDGSTSEKVRWEQVNLKPPSPREFNPAISRNLEKVILKCLQKDPALRYTSALELLQAAELALGNVGDAHDFGTEPTPIEQPVANPIPRQEKAKPKKLVEKPVQPKHKQPTNKSFPAWLGILGIIFIVIVGVIVATNQHPSTPIPAATATFTAAPTLGIGSSMISPKDGMKLLYVPAGNFLMGPANSDPNAKSWEKPQHTVYLDAFWIDQTDVTNAMYSKCVSARACNLPTNLNSNTRSSYYGNSQFDNYPVIYVDWNMAKTYCEWTGRQLPTEAQWEKAARGMDGRTYPWGNNVPDDTLLNYNLNLGDTTAVGQYPKGASPYGALDMAGNVSEWVADWFSDTYYQSSPSSNPIGPDTGTDRVVRGGSWYTANQLVRSTESFIRKS